MASPWTVVITVKPSSNPNVRPGSSELTWTVDPMHLEIEQGDEVEWVVDWAGCEEPMIIVHPKKGRWPFSRRSHSGLGRAASGSMKTYAAGKNYRYGIVVVCPGETDPGRNAVVIDPDMDVLG